MKRCVQCQNDLPDTAVHCVYCGSKQPAAAPVAGPGARTVMGYPGMANEMARQGSAPPPAARPAPARGANQVSGFEATQALPGGDRQRDGGGGFGGPPPGVGGPGPRGASPGPQGFGPGAQHGYGSGPPRDYGPPPDPGFGPRPGSQPDPAFAARPGSQPIPHPQHLQQPPHPQHGYGSPPPTPGFGPGPQGQHPGPYGPPPGDPAFASGPQGFGPPPDPFSLGPRHGSQPPPGYGPPQPQHGYGPPGDPGGYGAPPNMYGPPPAGSGFNPMHGPQGMPQHGYGPPPAGFHIRPETELVAPLRPPYPMVEGPRRGMALMEPWSESLKTLMLVFGVLLVACFVAPWAVLPGETTFSWTLLSAELPISIKLVPILFAATGVLAVVLGAIPMSSLARGFAAAGIGLAPIIFHSVAPAFDWRKLIGLIGAVTLVSGLLVRSHYTGEMLGRLMATIGAICVLLQVLIPEGGAVPLVQLFEAIGQGTGAMKFVALLNLVPVVLAILAFLVWLPPPGRAGAHILAWILIVWPLVAAIGSWLAGGNVGDTLKTGLSLIIYIPVAQMAWTALTGFGVATVVGKQLEHR